MGSGYPDGLFGLLSLPGAVRWAAPLPSAETVSGPGSVPLLLLGTAALLAVLAACFVSAEVALSRVSRLTTKEMVRERRFGAQRLHAITRDSARYLNLVLLLRVTFEVLATAALVTAAIIWLGPGWLAVVLGAVAMIVVDYVLIGVAPRILGRQYPEAVALASANVVYPVTLVLGPLAQVLVLLGRALTPGKGGNEGPFSSEDELRDLVDLAEQRHVIEPTEREMIHSVFELDDTMVREVMVPRTDIVFIDHDTVVDDGLALALRSGFSRIPVAGANEDDVVGILYLKDVMARLHDKWSGVEENAADEGRTVRDIMRAATYVPDSKPINELLREMQQQRIHVAVVIDEYGGTAGLVTIEDIVEEIVGEITDEYDDEVPPIERLGDDRARVTARLPIGELAELFGVVIEADEVETVGGLLAYVLGQVPAAGSTAVFAGLRLTAEDPSGRRNSTATVLVEKLAESSGRFADQPSRIDA